MPERIAPNHRIEKGDIGKDERSDKEYIEREIVERTFEALCESRGLAHFAERWKTRDLYKQKEAEGKVEEFDQVFFARAMALVVRTMSDGSFFDEWIDSAVLVRNNTDFWLTRLSEMSKPVFFAHSGGRLIFPGESTERIMKMAEAFHCFTGNIIFNVARSFQEERVRTVNGVDEVENGEWLDVIQRIQVIEDPVERGMAARDYIVSMFSNESHVLTLALEEYEERTELFENMVKNGAGWFNEERIKHPNNKPDLAMLDLDKLAVYCGEGALEEDLELQKWDFTDADLRFTKVNFSFDGVKLDRAKFDGAMFGFCCITDYSNEDAELDSVSFKRVLAEYLGFSVKVKNSSFDGMVSGQIVLAATVQNTSFRDIYVSHLTHTDDVVLYRCGFERARIDTLRVHGGCVWNFINMEDLRIETFEMLGTRLIDFRLQNSVYNNSTGVPYDMLSQLEDPQYGNVRINPGDTLPFAVGPRNRR